MAPNPTEDIWKLLSARLRSFILARVLDEQEAADLLQETFLRIHKKIGSVRDEERLNAWVFQIARNLITDHHRARTRISVPADPPDLPTRGTNANREVASWIPAAIDNLPEKYRTALRLYEIEGLPQKEISHLLGVSLSGAKSRIQRGRQKLKEVLEDCCSFELDRRGNVLGWQARSRCDSCE